MTDPPAPNRFDGPGEERDDHGLQPDSTDPPEPSAAVAPGGEPVQPPAPASATPAAEQRRRRPGPGLPESLLWMIGLSLAQALGMVIAAVVIAAILLMDAGTDVVSNYQKDPGLFLEHFLVPLFAIVQAIVILAAITAAAVRVRPQTGRQLGITGMPHRHTACLIAVMLPIMLLGKQLHLWALRGWEIVLKQFPPLEEFNQEKVHEFVESIAENTPLPLLLAIIAVVPAVAEELVFRGVIGRGLVARWGIVGGVLLTSLLFAAAHVFPPQAVALLPLACLLHVSYLATRSLLAPMMIHLLNNGWAMILIKYDDRLDLPVFGEDPLTTPLLIGCVFCVLALGGLMWSMRVEHHLPDGTVWHPGFATASAPPARLQAVTQCRRPGQGILLAAAVSLVVFAATFVPAL